MSRPSCESPMCTWPHCGCKPAESNKCERCGEPACPSSNLFCSDYPDCPRKPGEPKPSAVESSPALYGPVPGVGGFAPKPEVQAPEEVWIVVRKVDSKALRLSRDGAVFDIDEEKAVRYVRAKDGGR